MEIKYHKAVYDFSKRSVIREDGSLPPFTFGQNPSKGKNVTWFFLRYILPIIAVFFRKFLPVFRFSGIFIVSRRSDIEDILRNEAGDFSVPYSPEMQQLGGKDNILSMDGDLHDATRERLMKAFKKEDVERVANWVLEDANALLDSGGGKIDIYRDLITRTATESCCRLFGLNPANSEEFAHWSFAISEQIFADFELKEKTWEQAQIAAAHLRALIQDGVNRVHSNNTRFPDSDRERITLIDRLVTYTDMQDEDIVATIIGLLTAFVPTDTLAAGNMLDIILHDSNILKRAKTAAKSGDRAAMRKVILESGTLFPALSPGLFRLVKNTTKIGAKTVNPGDVVLVLIPSGLRDRRSKTESKMEDAWLMFGHGPHICLGAELSLAHITSVFMALFARDELAVARGKSGKLKKIGAFHDRQDFTYKSLKARGGHVVMTFPTKTGLDREKISERIKTKLSNPANDDIRNSFWKESDVENGDYGRVQFSSISVVEAEPQSKNSIVIFEINGDGEPDDLVDYISRKCDYWLRPLIVDIAEGGETIRWDKDLATFLKKHVNKLHFRPWGTTGLLYEGLPGLTVKEIYINSKIADTARDIIRTYLKFGYYRLELKAAHILRRARRVLLRDNFLMLRKSWRLILNEKMDPRNPKNESDIYNPDKPTAPGRSSIIKPSRSHLQLTDYTPWENMLEPAPKMLKDPSNLFIPIFAIAGFSLICFTIYILSSGGFLMSFVVSALLFLPLTMLVIWLLKLRLNKLERTDFVDNEPASKGHIEKIAELENHPSHAHNHIVAIMPFKKGLFRRFSFAFTLWGIFQTVKHWFRPGFVVTMGTIHVARWFRVKGTNIFAFLSNYDGTWESYLEDFITRANQGQSAAWSHGVGFPRTKDLISNGAEDGDNFKRWVRKQQRETLFWYSRFPEMTTEQIRRDAMIVEGLSKSVSDTDAKRWLGYFGSEQRQSRELESQEIQSLVFTGYSKQDYADALLIKLPKDKEKISDYLKAIAGIDIDVRNLDPQFDFPSQWIKKNSDFKIELPLEARIRFGDNPIMHGGLAIGFTSSGLKRAGLDKTGAEKSFPYAFDVGMGKRAKILGDDESKHNEWRFSDDVNAPQGAEAILLIYGNEAGSTHSDLVQGHLALLTLMGGSVVHHIPCQPVKIEKGNKSKKRSLKLEHFGFRDGISQPVIQGTNKHREAPERDVIAPGEFILGYQNHQGYVSPPVTLGSIFDIDQTLSNFSPDESNDFPYFGIRTSTENKRDFGRNGTYLAVRQLDQDVDGFQSEMERVAGNLKEDYAEADELAGGSLSSEWVAAKVIGRWQDGTPLIGNKTCPLDIPLDKTPHNDFTYGEDDPRGYACPLGSHIRRTNPRDSMEPGNKEEQLITNRHRLLRRGRSYEYKVTSTTKGKSEKKKGLLFMSICGDLERQFEFVQRTWINKTSFHGLKNEHDPLMGGPVATSNIEGNAYTIPTPSGPLHIPDLKSFITLQGGGYFFMPSRASLAFLINRSR